MTHPVETLLAQQPAYATRVMVRTAFLALILLAPLHYMFARYGVEPWPTFSLPRFAGGAAAPSHYALKQINAITPDGQSVGLEWDELFDLPGGVSAAVQSLNFSPRARPPQLSGFEESISSFFAYYPFSNYWEPRIGVPHGNDPETREYLKAQLAKKYPDHSFERIEFTWYSVEGYIRGTEIPGNANSDTYVVQLP